MNLQPSHPPRISVVMAVFNREHMVARAIRSILDQDFDDFEFIIVDDGSADRTIDTIRRFTDPRIRLIILPVNGGIGFARNIGVSLARGAFIATMDSDDVAMPDRLGKQYAYLHAHDNVDILGSWV